MNKKKLIITITSLCLVVVAAVAAVVGVVAASQQTVNSSITVNYQAINVKASVSYATRLQHTEYGSEAGTITFSAAEAERTEDNSISIPSITLGGRTANDTWYFERYTVIRFKFHNAYASGAGRALSVATSGTVTAFDTTGNYAVAFAAEETEPAIPTTLSGLSGDTPLESSWISSNSSWHATSSSAAISSIAQGGDAYVYVLVAMINPTLDTTFTNTNITFTLTSVVSGS